MGKKELIDNYSISTGLPHGNSKVVLIDCMDTIVARDVSLDSLLSIWANKVGKEFDLFSKYLLYYRREVVHSTMHNTVPIDVIYGEIFEQCSYFDLIESCRKEKFIERAHQIELEIELHHQHLIEDTISFLREQKKKGVSVYCVSDFRLSASDIMNFFIDKGVGDLFSGVFSSCDVGKTKEEGGLYSFVLDSIKKDSSECVMIGDNFNSDCVNAGKNGIKSYWLKNNRHSVLYLMKDVFYRLF